MDLRRTAAATFLCLAFTAAPAAAGDPVMALDDVRPGMRCTGYSVVSGVDPVAFDVEILDIVDGLPNVGTPGLLVSVSGPAVAETGVGPGFSGSPIYCPDASGVPRVAGAISEAIGEYEGKAVLATPIEAILAVSPEPQGERPVGRRSNTSATNTPLIVSGLSARVAAKVTTAAERSGRRILAAPAGPLASSPRRALRGGSAVAVGLSTGDIRLAAIGTVSYVDANRVWAFGHGFDTTGPRSLLLQDAYVYRVVNDPQASLTGGSYKLAAPGRTIGTLTNDGFSAVAGITGRKPPTIPIEVRVTDADAGVTQTTRVQAADETDVGNPSGGSTVSFVAPLAVAEGVSRALGNAQGNLRSRMCASIRVSEFGRPLRFCNSYVAGSESSGASGLGSGVTGAAGEDLGHAIAAVESFKYGPLHVRDVRARVTLNRGARLAQLVDVSMPRRVPSGGHARVRILLRQNGKFLRRSFRFKVPRGLRPGHRTLVFRGPGADRTFEEELLLESGEFPRSPQARSSKLQSPKTVMRRAKRRLQSEVASISRYDGLTLRTRVKGKRRELRVYDDPTMRISGKQSVHVRVLRFKRRR
ncbi:MAG: hypothetical protein M3P40_04090 [Actinomycetota bacterium]|nr:hypothetical protein [Actinomycetota bacterium]